MVYARFDEARPNIVRQRSTQTDEMPLVPAFVGIFAAVKEYGELYMRKQPHEQFVAQLRFDVEQFGLFDSAGDNLVVHIAGAGVFIDVVRFNQMSHRLQ